MRRRMHTRWLLWKRFPRCPGRTVRWDYPPTRVLVHPETRTLASKPRTKRTDTLIQNPNAGDQNKRREVEAADAPVLEPELGVRVLQRCTTTKEYGVIPYGLPLLLAQCVYRAMRMRVGNRVLRCGMVLAAAADHSDGV
eukprot:1388869-Rhodomonas_salina.4